MKKYAAVFLTLALTLSLTACGSLPNSVSDLLDGNSVGTGRGYPNEEGYAEGFLGDTMHTAFFDYTVTCAYTCMEFDGLTPVDGYKFLVAEVTITNTTTVTQPMYFYDFQIQWDLQEGEGEDENFDFPLFEEVTDETGATQYVSASEEQLPAIWELSINGERTGKLVYAVPEGAKDYSISFQEFFESEENEDGEEGDVFFVYFNAETR